MAKRVKAEDQGFMDWLDELVQSSPEARAAYEDEMVSLGAFGAMAKRNGTKPRELSPDERADKLDALLGKPARND